MKPRLPIAVVLLAGVSATWLALRSVPDASAAWPKPFCTTRGVDAEAPPCSKALGPKIEDLRGAGEIVFAVIGDMGTGDDNQRRVGKALSRVCGEQKCRFAIAVGDNLYDGPKSLDDPRFSTWFEAPYAGLNFPIWLALGNHDWLGDPQVSVDYTGRAAKRASGPYWFMPSGAYSVPGLPAWLDLVALDTQSIKDNNTAAIAVQKKLLDAVVPRGKDALARWTFLFAHHPTRSSGSHGDGRATASFLAPWLDGTAVDLAFYGHDHNQEHFDAGRSQVFVQGASGQLRPLGFDPARRRCKDDAQQDCSRFAALELGFGIVRVTESAVSVDFIGVDEAGTEKSLYTWSADRTALAARQSK
jgi:tartrate-resistant acid phosphatase type 5